MESRSNRNDRMTLEAIIIHLLLLSHSQKNFISIFNLLLFLSLPIATFLRYLNQQSMERIGGENYLPSGLTITVLACNRIPRYSPSPSLPSKVHRVTHWDLEQIW